MIGRARENSGNYLRQNVEIMTDWGTIKLWGTITHLWGTISNIFSNMYGGGGGRRAAATG